MEAVSTSSLLGPGLDLQQAPASKRAKKEPQAQPALPPAYRPAAGLA